MTSSKQSIVIFILNTDLMSDGKLFSCSYEVVEPADGEFGVMDETGSFSGLVGLVQQGVRTPSIILELLVSKQQPMVVESHEIGSEQVFQGPIL